MRTRLHDLLRHHWWTGLRIDRDGTIRWKCCNAPHGEPPEQYV